MFTIHSCFSSPISVFSLVKWLFVLYFSPVLQLNGLVSYCWHFRDPYTR